jgi:hypothetical protein
MFKKFDTRSYFVKSRHKTINQEKVKNLIDDERKTILEVTRLLGT